MKKFTCFLALTVALLADNLEQIKLTKTIKIGIREALPPLSIQNADGVSSGFEVELAKASGKEIVGEDGKIELVVLKANERIPFLKENKIDIAVANLAQTKERENDVDFSVPYLLSDLAVLTHKGSAIKQIEQLSGKKILYTKGTTSEEYKNSGKLNADWIECEGKIECFNMLQNDEADAYMSTNILLANLQLNDDKVELGIPRIAGNSSPTCVGVKKGNKELINEVDKAIFKLSDSGFFTQQYTDYLEPYFQNTVGKNYLILEGFYKTLQFK